MNTEEEIVEEPELIWMPELNEYVETDYQQWLEENE